MKLNLQKCIGPENFPYYASKLLKIKDINAQLIPLTLNSPQARLHTVLENLRAVNKLQRVIVLKARREGISTYAEGRLFQASHMNENTESVVISHEKDSGTKIFNMCKLYFECLPKQLQPMTRYASKQELVFENPDPKTRTTNPGLRSSIEVLTAGKKDVGRSAGFHNLHASEISSWPFAEDVIPAIVPTIPKTSKSLIIYESTAKGVNNFFHQEWLRAVEGESNFYPFFLAWFDLKDYRREFNTKNERAIFALALNDEEKELQSVHNLSLEQLCWRRLTIADLKGDVELFRQEYPATPEEAFIVSGAPIFDRRKLRQMAIKCQDKKWGNPQFIGHITDRGLVPDDARGELKIWRPALKDQLYVMGVDVADGGEGGDYSCIEIFRKLPAPYVAEQVAEWHGHMDPYNFAHIVEQLGRIYNEALASVETNAHGLATQQELQRTYWNIYQSSHLDRFDSKLTPKLGWDTTVRTKKLLISFCTHCISDLTILVRSADLVRECMTFIRDDSGNGSASGGGYDDRVMAAMIALFTMHQSIDDEPLDDLNVQTEASPLSIPPNYIDPEFAWILDGWEGEMNRGWLSY